MKPIARLAAAAIVVAACARATAAELPVDLELVLAVDVSASMDESEQRLQRLGYVAAFGAPRVIAAIQSGRYKRIAVAFVEWADAGHQAVVMPWTLVDSVESAQAVAGDLASAPFTRAFGTAMASAIAFSTTLFADNGYAGTRLAIDISGDGPSNVGPPLLPAREAAVAQGITINGLPIMIRVGWPTGLYSLTDLDLYFRDCVIAGPDAFIVVVKRRAEFAEAIERKLVMEIISAHQDYILPIGDFQALGGECSTIAADAPG